MDFRKKELDDLIENSKSDFLRERYGKHVELMNKAHDVITESMKDVKTHRRLYEIQRYMDWANEWFANVGNQENDITIMALGESLRRVKCGIQGKEDVDDGIIDELVTKIQNKSKEYDY